MTDGVSIVAMGARTPLGLDAESSAAATRAGISRVADHPIMVDVNGDPLRCGRVSTIDPAAASPSRMMELALNAIAEATLQAFGQSTQPGPVPVFLALPSVRPGFGPAEIAAICRGIETASMTAPLRIEAAVSGGHAGVIHALELALKHNDARSADVSVVVGVDSYLDLDAIDWLESDRRLARAKVRGGFAPGEAAGALVVASQAGRARLGLRPLAGVRGLATGQEPRSIDSIEGLFGEGLTDVVRRASQSLRLPDERVENIYCDINGERHRTDEWGFTVMRAWRVFKDGSEYTTGVSNWGDVGAASGALNCILAIHSWRRGYARGPRSLVWASSQEGLRGALILERTEA